METAYTPAWQAGLLVMSKTRRSTRKRRRGAGKNGGQEHTGGASLTGLDRLLDRYLVLLLFLALISLTLLSAETPLLTSLLGLILCVTGMVQRRGNVDLWVLIPLISYQVFSVISFCMAYNGASTGMIADFICYIPKNVLDFQQISYGFALLLTLFPEALALQSISNSTKNQRHG